ncbi:hypothetical protein HMPREF1544_03156 [Mucor circinelloides 1006PhL]|uniref:HNH nuclease domain-containing protein n=1 Tax=Mucor circinelloides f. circinelloides (strain 1006PhL) TaxID=1220926 RepID=S2JJE3_MUCC1|nr:hypothetical protein HMPREF1544_03156 [Mucor circinelloides 1006PhL]KAG1073102.1 hypothetical protein G6F42_025845 [Rhizopus arrhizus]
MSAIKKEIEHLFNPDRKLSDFPGKVIAKVPDDRVTKEYHLTSKGVLIDPVTEREYSLFDDEGKYYCFYFKNDRSRSVYVRADEIMVYSFYHGMCGEQQLMDVVHHDRFSRNLSIETLVPIFSLEQLQSYFVWRLSEMNESRFLVAKSHKPDNYSMSSYLVSEDGVVFGLESKIFLSPKKGKSIYACLSVVVDLIDGGKATINTKEHLIVAATFREEGMGPGKEVHHIDGNPRNNAARNLVWLTKEEHMQVHHGICHQRHNARRPVMMYHFQPDVELLK